MALETKKMADGNGTDRDGGGQDPAALLATLEALRADTEAGAAERRRAWGASAPEAGARLDNLAAYLALRTHDLRPLQRRLMALGLSSLGRIESRVLPTLDLVRRALAGLVAAPLPYDAVAEAAVFAGETALSDAATDLLGPGERGRRTRIMVTLPGVAAIDAALVGRLVEAGMDVARINCAHDDAGVWRDMAARVRDEAARQGRQVRILMDIAGPKIRTAAIATRKKKAEIAAGDALLLVEGAPEASRDAPFAASLTLPGLLARLKPGHRFRYDDGRVEGVVESVEPDRALVRIGNVRGGSLKLKPEKGVNLPDTALGLTPITHKDDADLDAVSALADMVGYSFVSHADDLDLLDAALARHGEAGRTLGVIAKIEQPEAVRNLPALIARALGRRPFGVMIARGDLGAELGFERLAEMQEEILWICEAASVPVIWATQVLETLVKEGLPTRAEMTDAAMAARAECVMLNKGAYVTAGVETLDRLLKRMDGHGYKKTPALRALSAWAGKSE